MKPVEWPTLLLFAGVYIGWIALSATIAHALPQAETEQFTTVSWWLMAVSLLILPLLLTLHSSLQHEVIHGHPTASQTLNSLLAAPALSLLMPYGRFEDLHLKHHRDWLLTDPYDDTESSFLSRAQWQSLSSGHRRLLQMNNTLLGRMIIGPGLMYMRFFASECRLLIQGAPGVAASWARHLAGAVPVLVWLAWLDYPLSLYLLLGVWPATSLLLLRAYLEHLPESEITGRTAVVESGPLMSLLYLNNNLHRVHHDQPCLPWYRIPQVYRQSCQSDAGLVTIRGYRRVFRDHALSARFPVAHPCLRTGVVDAGQKEIDSQRR